MTADPAASDLEKPLVEAGVREMLLYFPDRLTGETTFDQTQRKIHEIALAENFYEPVINGVKRMVLVDHSADRGCKLTQLVVLQVILRAGDRRRKIVECIVRPYPEIVKAPGDDYLVLFGVGQIALEKAEIYHPVNVVTITGMVITQGVFPAPEDLIDKGDVVFDVHRSSVEQIRYC